MKRSAGPVLAVLLAVLGSCGPSSSDEPEAPPPEVTRRRDAVGAPLGELVLVKDLTPNPVGWTESSKPQRFATVGDTLYIATDKNLWAYTAQGARIPMIGGKTPLSSSATLVPLGNTLYVLGNYSTMARTDGTDEGSVALAPDTLVFAGSEDGVCRVGSTLYLSLHSWVSSDWELWRYSEAQGFSLVKNINPTSGSAPRRLVALDTGRFFFTAQDGVHGEELWTSDGTEAGTSLVKDLTPGTPSTAIQKMVPAGGLLYFAAEGALWRTDGSEAGTRRVQGAFTPIVDDALGSMAAVGSTLYFLATDSAGTRGLWMSDGTDAGTRRFQDAVPGFTALQPAQLRTFDGRLLFTAVQSIPQVWVSDGTAAGTVRLSNFDARGRSYPQRLTVAGSRFYAEVYTCELSPCRTELWAGSSAGLVAGSLGAFGSFDLRRSGVSGDTLYFAATDSRGEEPWRTDGTVAGTRLVTDLNPAPVIYSTRLSNGVALGGTLVFTTDQSPTSWTSDGSAVGTVPNTAMPSRYWSQKEPSLVMNGVMYFVDRDSSGGELWRTDGTRTGTWRVKDILPGSESSQPQFLLGPLGNRFLFYAARASFSGKGIWVSDGTSEGTTFVKAVVPSTAKNASPAADAVTLGSAIYFAADDTAGSELWKSDGTAEGTVRVADIVPGATGSLPHDLTAHQGALFFLAVDPAASPSAQALYRLDPATDTVVKVSAPGAFVGPLTSLGSALLVFTSTSALWSFDSATGLMSQVVPAQPFTRVSTSALASTGGLLFFVASTSTTGAELWRTDGTGAGTRLVKDIRPGTGAGVDGTVPMLGLTGHGRVLLRADDGVTGGEPWESDGTPEGTRMLRDIHPTGSSAPAMFVRAGNGVFFSANDGAHGQELWRLQLPLLPGDAPPVVTCPAPVVAEALSASGAPVSWPPATATDDGAVPPRVTSSPASGSTFPLGTTRVAVRAEDDTGNLSFCDFPVTVRDTTPPSVTCPADVTAASTGIAGAYVVYASARATDTVSAVPTVTYSQASDSLFPIGNTQVTATAADAVGNTASCTFRVRVTDASQPWIRCPSDITAEATQATGAPVGFAVTAHPDLTLTYSREPGALFALGTTTVTATAASTAGDTRTCSFRVTVRDTTAPVLSCPQSLALEATQPAGASGVFSVSATDAVTASPALTFSHASGSTFPLGTTQVTVTARDAAGLSSSCSFPVTVADTTKPFLGCAAPLFIEAEGAQGTPVTYDWVQAWDSVSPVTLSYSHPSGTVFPRGFTDVTVLARDAAGNTQACAFTVRVVDSLAPALSCPQARVVEALGPQGAPGGFTVTATDAVTASPRLEYSHLPTAPLPLGTTQVTVTAWDEADNHRACSFPVTVVDTTAPTLSCPAPVTAEATAASGTPVTYGAATASDTVSAVGLSYTQASGTRFAPGRTPVTVTARDAAGNRATCAFDVTVRDTTAPTLQCPADLVREASGSEGAVVDFVVPVRDAGSSRLVPTYSHAPGSVFPAGSTRVVVSARDAAGNSAQCSFLVTVGAAPRAER